MSEDERTLVEGVIAQLVRRFSMTPAVAGDAPVSGYVSRRHRLELRAHRHLGTLHLRSVPLDSSAWELTIRGHGSARNWLTAEIAASDTLDDAAIQTLHEIDLALDGLLRQALLARQSLLARRRDELVRMGRAILAEHAALQRLDHALDRHARQNERSSVTELFGQARYLRDQWLAIPEHDVRSESRNVAELGMAGSRSEGYRFYLECIMHGSSAEEAAQYLAGEITSMLHDGQLSASIEPIDHFAPFLNDQLRLFSDVVMDARDGADTASAPAASSFQIAMERLGA